MYGCNFSLNFIFGLFVVSIWKYKWCFNLLLYLVILLFSFLSSRSIFVNSFWVLHREKNFYIDNYVICEKTQLYSLTFFLTWIFYLVLFYLIAVAWTSSAVLNGSDESKHLCLVSDLRKMAFYLSRLCMVLAVEFS